MNGAYPCTSNEGHANPVFDIDSVCLISILAKMNRGFDEGLEKTGFAESCQCSLITLKSRK
jgi:hypothetical protein